MVLLVNVRDGTFCYVCLMDSTGTTARLPARPRLVSAAAQIFYTEGIHSVPVDRIIDEAQVTRATFYRYFAGKEDLVLEYIQLRDQRIRDAAAATAAHLTDPADMLKALVDGVGDEVCEPGFRGCPFINAAAEYPDPGHPVHQAVTTHRKWFRETLVAVLTAMEHPTPEPAADTLVMLRDGAMVGGYLDDAERVRGRLANAVRMLVDHH